MNPTFTLDTKYGPFTVLVLDPTPRTGRPHEENILKLSSDGPVTINRVAVTVARYYNRYPKRAQDGTPTGEFSVHGTSGITRVGSYDEPTAGIRKEVDAIADEALRKILADPDLLQAARALRLRDDAERKVDRANELRREAAALEWEAETLRQAADGVASFISR